MLKKSFNLQVVYLKDAKPSELRSAFDLQLKLLGIPNGDRVNQHINPVSISDSRLGSPYLVFTQYVRATGFDPLNIPNPKIHTLTQSIRATGLNASLFGTAQLKNKNQTSGVTGFNATLYGRPTTYNLRQYLRFGGMHTAVFGTAYMQGGVKYVGVTGFNALAFPTPRAINTRADQFARPSGIVPPTQQVPNPNVSPRYVRPSGIIAWSFGTPWVQRNPSPKGFTTDIYGTAWISHSPRYLEPNYIDAFNSGYPKVFDPTQKIGVTGANTVIPGGVFGDISIRNTRRIITVSGFYAQSFSDWGVVESNLRNIIPNGLDNQNFGSNTIRNKTPSIAPIGINSFIGLNAAIGYRIRTIKPSGFYQPKFGTHILTKPPELKPSGNNQNIFGPTWISNKTRNIYAGLGHESLAIGEINVWHFTRYLKPTGIFNDGYGAPRVEHGRRAILAKGSAHTTYGNNSWVSYAVRSLLPSSIIYPNIPNHRVGGTQNIQPFGYVATRFGSRIIPESQLIYPQGFINPFGISAIDLWKKYIKPNGFLTNGQEGGHRFGTHKFWNLRQYIVQFYDGDSGLVPPKWTGWTSIENRNKTIGVIGSNLARVVEPYIENKARPLLPSGFDAHNFGKSMIADRVRYLRLQGMEAPYIGRWSIIYNAAPVIAAKDFITDTFGMASILNTRRYFNRIGNFESLEMGKPMVADRIRTLKFEQRYTIAPIYMPLPKIDLHTRYIEEVGRFDDYQAFGSPALSIHWKIITPRWTLRDAYGYPTVKNVTPELGTRGRNSEEFGHTFLRTQWRELLHKGNETIAWGRTIIAFRDRQFSVNGVVSWNVPRPKVTKTGIPPYYPQYIWLDTIEIDGDFKGNYGIGIPVNQVPYINVKSNVLFPTGFMASRHGNHHTQSNGILVQPGLQELTIGNPFVGLKDRMIIVPTLGDFMQIGWDNRPRISPHTVYAVMDSSNQARQNHPISRRMHYVNSDGGNRAAGEVFGQTRVTHFHRKILAGLGFQGNTTNSSHWIQLKKRYINLADFGIKSWRMGFHVVGPFDQWIEQFDSNNMQAFGRPSLSIPYGGAFYIKPNGIPSLILNRPIVDFFNRSIKALGGNHLQMGSRKTSDTPFMWQGLRVGELVKGNYGGFNTQSFGQTWISLKVREVAVNGFDMFISEYDYTQFDKRMRITRNDLPKPVYYIQPMGFDNLTMGVLNIKPAAHYIRPDGNADQFRKGAF